MAGSAYCRSIDREQHRLGKGTRDQYRKTAETDFELASEIGDLFFVLVNLARWKKVDAESALRGTNLKFKKRFAHVEQGAKRQARNLSDLTLEEMDALWNQAKKRGL